MRLCSSSTGAHASGIFAPGLFGGLATAPESVAMANPHADPLELALYPGAVALFLIVGSRLLALAAGRDPGSLRVLRRYERWRKGENLLMLGAMDGFKRLFAERSLPVRWLRNAGMRGVGALGPLKQQLMKHAMGIGQ